MSTPGSWPPHPVMLYLYLAAVQLYWSSWGVVPGSRTPPQKMGGRRRLFQICFPYPDFPQCTEHSNWSPPSQACFSSCSFYHCPSLVKASSSYLMVSVFTSSPLILIYLLSFSDPLFTEQRNVFFFSSCSSIKDLYLKGKSPVSEYLII